MTATPAPALAGHDAITRLVVTATDAGVLTRRRGSDGPRMPVRFVMDDLPVGRTLDGHLFTLYAALTLHTNLPGCRTLDGDPVPAAWALVLAATNETTGKWGDHTILELPNLAPTRPGTEESLVSLGRIAVGWSHNLSRKESGIIDPLPVQVVTDTLTALAAVQGNPWPANPNADLTNL